MESFAFPVIALAEIYDPETDNFSETGSLVHRRQTHAAVLLGDGRVLVTGGVGLDGIGPVTRTAEVYDPVTGTFSEVGEMTVPRLSHAAILLEDGRALIVGGSGLATESAELYDPTTATFTETGSLHGPCPRPNLLTLEGGMVLAACPQTIERYDATAGTFELLYEGDLPGEATLLEDGRLLLTGGIDHDQAASAPPLPPGAPHGNPIASTNAASYFNPTTLELTEADSLNEARALHELAAFPDGRVLIWGGVTDTQFGGFASSVELYDPTTGQFETAVSETDSRVWHTMTLLRTGCVLIVGKSGSPMLRPAELACP